MLTIDEQALAYSFASTNIGTLFCFLVLAVLLLPRWKFSLRWRGQLFALTGKIWLNLIFSSILMAVVFGTLRRWQYIECGVGYTLAKSTEYCFGTIATLLFNHDFFGTFILHFATAILVWLLYFGIKKLVFKRQLNS